MRQITAKFRREESSDKINYDDNTRQTLVLEHPEVAESVG